MALKQYEQHISMTDFKQQGKLNFLVRQVKICKVAVCKNKTGVRLYRGASVIRTGSLFKTVIDNAVLSG